MTRPQMRSALTTLGTALMTGFISFGLAGCGSSSNASKADAATSSADIPPTGTVALEAWLAAGSYKSWSCESAIHMSRDPSPHGFNRICSNAEISSNATGTGNWPVNAAAVKELYATIDGASPVGYAVYLKTNADSAAGSNWYWYERVPTTSTAAPHDSTGLVADGMGDGGPPKTICVGCHGAAGQDALHTPSPGGRDQVYTPVH